MDRLELRLKMEAETNKASDNGNGTRTEVSEEYVEWLERQVKNNNLSLSASGSFSTDSEIEEAAESFGSLYSQDPNFADGCEAGWKAGANWMKEKYKDSNNR